MLHLPLHAAVWIAAPLLQESIIAPPARLPLPRPAANAPMVEINKNLESAGRLSEKTLKVDFDILEAAWRPEGPDDPVVRVFAIAERGKTPQVPAPMIRAEVGTRIQLSLRNRTDSALMMSGFRKSLDIEDDTINIAPNAVREISFTLDSIGTFFYWGVMKGLSNWRDRDWLDSQLSGALIVDPKGGAKKRDRVFIITEWFHAYPDRPFESALVFNGKAWPYNDRLELTQNDSVHWRFINAAAIEHPLHLHGFYYRITHHGGERSDTAVAPEMQPLQNMQLLHQGATMDISWSPTTPGNWVFHCHFASHVGDHVSLHGSPDPNVIHDAHMSTTFEGSAPGGHQMRGLVIGMHVKPAPGYREPAVTDRRTIRLFAQKQPGRLQGRQTAYGFMLQRGDSAPPANTVQIPGPVLELKRGEPVRLVVKNNMDEYTGVHWHGLEIESYPDGVPNFSGMGTRIMPPIAPKDSFVAEFTPPRSGTFPYHSHLHELRQIGSGMYGAIVVTDAPRDTTHDHVIVAGGGGLPVFEKSGPAFLLVNGRAQARPLKIKVGETHRLRIVSIHADEVLRFRLGTPASALSWTPIARDGADLPSGLRVERPATIDMGPGETADFLFTPREAGEFLLEVAMWPTGGRVVMPVVVEKK